MRQNLFHSCLLWVLVLTAAFPQDAAEKKEEQQHSADSLQVIRFKVGSASWLGRAPSIFMNGHPISKINWGSRKRSRDKNREGKDVTLLFTEELEWDFTMRNPEMDTLRVTAFHRQTRRELKSREKSYVFSFGDGYVDIDTEPKENEVLMESDFLSADLDIPGHEGFPWQLLIEDSSGETEYLSGGAIQNGNRVIRILPWSPGNTDERPTGIQAVISEIANAHRSVGVFEFVEGDRSLGILEFSGWGSGKKNNTLRLRADLDPELKLLLASASVTLMHMMML